MMEKVQVRDSSCGGGEGVVLVVRDGVLFVNDDIS